VIIIGVTCWFQYHSTPMILPDSNGYLQFSNTRSLGYPLFLEGIRKTTGFYDSIPAIQLSIWLASLFYLILGLIQFLRIKWYGFLAVILIAINVELIKFSFVILTESLAMSLSMLFLGLILRVLMSKKSIYLALSSIIVGLAILVKPICWSWFLVLGGLWISDAVAISRSRKACLLSIPAILCIGLMTNLGSKYQSVPAESAIGESLIGKVGLLAEDTFHSESPRTMQVVARFSKPVTDILDQAPSWQFRYLLSQPYYDQFRYGDISQKIIQGVQQEEKNRHLTVEESRKLLALEILKQNAWGYVKDVFLNYLAIWQLWDLKTPAEAKAFKHWLQQLGHLPWIGSYPEFARQKPYEDGVWYAWIIRLLWGSIGVLTVIFPIGVGVRFLRGQPISGQAWYISLVSILIQVTYLFTVLIQAGLPRYGIIMYPAMVIVGVCVLDWAGFCLTSKHEKQSC